MILNSYTLRVLSVTLFLSCAGSISHIRRFKRRVVTTKAFLGDNVTTPAEKWFTQLLDHFQPTDTRTWKQRYGEVEDFYKAGGPVFLMIGGEGEEAPEDMLWGAWVGYAKKYNALMFQVEHRYYGKSHPTSDLSVENLKYLSSEQALADLAYFITSMNRQHKLPPDTKWVAFGGSYPGNLAAWVRYKYPHLIHAAVASSAPVLAKVDFPEYFDIDKDSLATYSEQCAEAVHAAIGEVYTLLKSSPGRKTIENEFKLCDPIDYNNHNDIANLLLALTENIAEAVQNDGPGGPHDNISRCCGIMVNESLGTPLQRFALYLMRNNCLEFKYDNSIKYYRNTSWDRWMGDDEDRRWTYQTCTEFGFYQTSERKDALFGDGITLDFYIQQCRDIFGKSFTKDLLYRAVERTNILYGGLDLKATRVVYVHGSIDPWHALGITKTRIPESPAIYINGTSHCANMDYPFDDDPPALKAARQEISMLIGKWLQEV